MPAEILFPVTSDLIDQATDQKGNAMAKSHYQFNKRQKELAKKKKKEAKKQRKLENKVVEIDETKTFAVIKPLYSSACHNIILLSKNFNVTN